jgi:hypothetical protein
MSSDFISCNVAVRSVSSFTSYVPTEAALMGELRTDNSLSLVLRIEPTPVLLFHLGYPPRQVFCRQEKTIE